MWDKPGIPPFRPSASKRGASRSRLLCTHVSVIDFFCNHSDSARSHVMFAPGHASSLNLSRFTRRRRMPPPDKTHLATDSNAERAKRCAKCLEHTLAHDLARARGQSGVRATTGARCTRPDLHRNVGGTPGKPRAAGAHLAARTARARAPFARRSHAARVPGARATRRIGTMMKEARGVEEHTLSAEPSAPHPERERRPVGCC